MVPPHPNPPPPGGRGRLIPYLARWTVLLLAADDARDDRYAPLGGQAVLEGVMMRGPKTVATAVRKPDGTMAVQVRPFVSWRDRLPLGNWPLLRGIITLVESLVMGIQSLNYSAEVASGQEEQAGPWAAALSIFIGLALAILIFMALPATLFMHLRPYLSSILLLNLLEGGLRLSLFVLYIWAIARLPDIDRLFYYHGAEHQTIFVHEDGKHPTVELARQKSPRHPRCGTSFLLITIMVSILLFSLLGRTDTVVLRVLSKLALFPLVAAFAYELIRMAGKAFAMPDQAYPWEKAAYVLTLPGLWLQRLTTRPAGDDQLETAIVALEHATV